MKGRKSSGFVSPEREVARWLDELCQFNSLAEYLDRAALDSTYGSRIVQLLKEVREFPIAGDMSWKQLPAGLLNSVSRLGFLQILLSQFAFQIEETLDRCRYRLNHAKSIIGLIELFDRSSSGDRPVTLSISAAEPSHGELQPNAATKVFAELQNARTAIAGTQSDLLDCRLTAEAISKTHYGSRQFLVTWVGAALNEVGKEADTCGEQYSRLVRDTVQGQKRFEESLKYGGRVDIDLRALERTARKKTKLGVAKLTAYAEIMMYYYFGDLRGAVKKLAESEKRLYGKV